MKKQTLKLTFSAMFLTLSILIPRIFHIFPGSGGIFLPMHIPVLLCGFILGWQYGLGVGLVAPMLNSLISGMPILAKVPYMTAELAAYGAFAGLFYVTLSLRKFKIRSFPAGVYISLVASLILGRVIYTFSLILALYALGVTQANPLAVIEAVVTGIPGIIIQLVLIPILLAVIEKTALFKNILEK